MQKKLGIIIPVASAPKHLDKALASIKNSIKNLNNILVFIVIDNISFKEDYLNIITNWQQKFEIKYIIHSETLGAGKSRDDALYSIDSEFITFLDDDDEYLKDITGYCDDTYDIISFNTNSMQPDAIWGSILSLIYKRNYLITNNFHFTSICNGFEDSIFRTITFLCAKNIKYINNVNFYKVNKHSDSYYSNRICYIDSELNKLYNIINHISLCINYYEQYIGSIQNYNSWLQCLLNITMGLELILNSSIINSFTIEAYYLCLTALKLLISDKLIYNWFDKLQIETSISNLKDLILFIHYNVVKDKNIIKINLLKENIFYYKAVDFGLKYTIFNFKNLVDIYVNYYYLIYAKSI